MTLQHCQSDWYAAQPMLTDGVHGLLRQPDEEVLRRLKEMKLVTADFLEGWGEAAFAAGWTDIELFGITLDWGRGQSPCSGLVPMIADGTIKPDLLDLTSEGVRAVVNDQLAAITGSADDSTIWLPKEDFAIARGCVWWRHPHWTMGKPAGVALH